MMTNSAGLTALFLVYTTAIISHTTSDHANVDGYPVYDNPDAYGDTEEGSFISLADLLESKRTALELQDLLNNILLSKRQWEAKRSGVSRMCMISTGGAPCNAESYSKAWNDHHRLSLSELSPGRRRRRQTFIQDN